MLLRETTEAKQYLDYWGVSVKEIENGLMFEPQITLITRIVSSGPDFFQAILC